ncbi:putative Alpha-ketoglutarate-dependent dioxygenase alkB [Cocos nucifera]|uniref:Putative Alpha-ketoglutarate-dependent dioxygenase alkB n=1 Tax=Cocos nucifera TaxID=13894 RepID=A0A8K0NCY3_COCNU|nr:putative Alpha-ketoglutarate-dependent dioxygenase alkB [Cocos nucifera]
MPSGEEFQPEAAKVNCFGPRMSENANFGIGIFDKSSIIYGFPKEGIFFPISNHSLGCKAIFLLGGKSRKDNPRAMFLRGGDIVLMAGQARECFQVS